MATTLREIHGILIFDEGHNSISTNSRLGKCLMKLPLELRILLSSTLFRKNFCEYFNILCFAGPILVHGVLQELDSEYRSVGEIANTAQHLLEGRARKLFLNNIEKKINSNVVEERMQCLYVLQKITNGFIDVYETVNSSYTLPDIQIYTLFMNTSDKQHEIAQKLKQKMFQCSGYKFEVELLMNHFFVV